MLEGREVQKTLTARKHKTESGGGAISIELPPGDYNIEPIGGSAGLGVQHK